MKRLIALGLLAFVALHSQAQWSLNGNAGTDTAIHFIGTTDNKDLIFKRNNVRAGLLGYNTSFGVNALNPNSTGDGNTAYGYTALAINTSGRANVAYGYAALYSNTTGSNNTAIGMNTLKYNTTGGLNTALGLAALFNNTTGGGNTATGHAALSKNTTGYGNTVNGFNTLYDNTIGYKNTALGYNTGLGIVTGKSNTILGANVISLPANLNNTIILADGDGNKKLYIDSAGNAGIGTTTPSAKLEIAGQVKITGGSPGINKVLTSDAGGLASWQILPALSGTGWNLTGNAGTRSDSNFIGTLDNVDLLFRRNNVKAGWINNSNTSFGVSSLLRNTSGENNTAHGAYSLSFNTTGNNNTAQGGYALHSNLSGENNTAIGFYSLLNNNIGKFNTAIGYNAGLGITEGSNNTLLGANIIGLPARLSNTIILADGAGNKKFYIDSAGNAGIGTTVPKTKLDVNGGLRFSGPLIAKDSAGRAGQILTSKGAGLAPEWTTPAAVTANAWGLTGNAETNPAINFIGTTDDKDIVLKRKNIRAGLLSIGNTSFGVSALNDGSTGTTNTAIGTYALGFNTTGSSNTAIGSNAMQNNTAGVDNTATGKVALLSNTLGIRNTATGHLALSSNTTGNYNTANGAWALIQNFTGSHNTAIGYYANVNDSNYSNTTLLGAYTIGTASNQVRIGNESVTSIGGQVGWTTFSDGRFKKDIKENVPGLEFINQLKPVTYHLDITGVNNYLRPEPLKDEEGKTIIPSAEQQEAIKAKEQILYTGFVAQEVEAAAKKINYNFSGVDAPKNEKDVYGLRYAEFVVPLVKAVQELSAKNDQLSDKNDQLSRENESQKAVINHLTSEVSELKTQMKDILQQWSELKGKTPGEVFSKATAAVPEIVVTQTTAGLKVYPNPNSGIFTITTSYPLKNAVVTLSDVNGKELAVLVQDIDQHSKKIQLNNVAQGTYLLKLTTGTTIEVAKIIVQ